MPGSTLPGCPSSCSSKSQGDPGRNPLPLQSSNPSLQIERLNQISLRPLAAQTPGLDPHSVPSSGPRLLCIFCCRHCLTEVPEQVYALQIAFLKLLAPHLPGKIPLENNLQELCFFFFPYSLVPKPDTSGAQVVSCWSERKCEGDLSGFTADFSCKLLAIAHIQQQRALLS